MELRRESQHGCGRAFFPDRQPDAPLKNRPRPRRWISSACCAASGIARLGRLTAWLLRLCIESRHILLPDNLRLGGKLRPHHGPLLTQKPLRDPGRSLQRWGVFGRHVPRLLPLLDRLIIVGARLARRRHWAASVGDCRRDVGVLIHTSHPNARKTSSARNSCNDTR